MKYCAISIIHFSPSSFNAGRLRFIGCRSVDSMSFPSSCFSICSAYQSLKHLFRRSFDCQVHGLKTISHTCTQWMLFCSKSLVTVLVIWPLKLSIMTSAGVSSSKVSRVLFAYGMIIFWMYWIFVNFIDQCFGKCVISQSGGNSVWMTPRCLACINDLDRQKITNK